MKITAREVAELVEGKLTGNPDLVLTGAQGIGEAGAGDVSFIANPKYLDRIAATGAGLLLVPHTMSGLDRPCVKVANPQLAFARVLWILYRERLARLPSGVHPSAVIAADAMIGEGAGIGAHCVIESGARIGRNARIMPQCYVGSGSAIGADCLIYPQVTIRESVTIGARAVIHSGTVIGSDGFGFVPHDNSIVKIPQIGRVEIGDDVELGANCAIDRGTTGTTRIGTGTKMDNLVHIAHNIEIGEHCIIVGQVGMAGSTKIGNFVTIAAQAGVGGHLKIGNRVTIAARAGVTTDLKDGEVVSGFPARPHREELKVQALIRRLPDIYAQMKKQKVPE